MVRMKTLCMTAALIVATALPAFAHPHPGTRVDARQRAQHQRMVQGWRQGDLTRIEARRLVRGQRQIRRVERRMLSDGHLGMRERMRLHRLQNRESRTIYRLRHNRQGRLI